MNTTVADEICNIFAAMGSSSYFGEPVSQLEHALQAASFAQQENAPDHLVIAALVHDIGHLLHGLDEQVADRGVDARHEEASESWLARGRETISLRDRPRLSCHPQPGIRSEFRLARRSDDEPGAGTVQNDTVLYRCAPGTYVG